MRRILPCFALLATLAATGTAPAQTPTTEVRVLAAGSLRAAMTDSAAAFEAAQPGVKVRLGFGASGLLKDRIAAGEAADVFASANMSHPEALAAAGKGGPVQRFARNAMCALARPGLALTPETLVPTLLDPAVRLGTSTPKADPAGDYAWLVFDRIEQAGHAGAAKALAAKALQLAGGPNSPPPPADRSLYGVLMAQGAADVFLTYCTNAVVAAREQPGLQVLPLPSAIDVSASYGITAMAGAPEAARRFVDFLLAPAGQAVLARHGFAPR